jgi:hypothetical protein
MDAGLNISGMTGHLCEDKVIELLAYGGKGIVKEAYRQLAVCTIKDILM